MEFIINITKKKIYDDIGEINDHEKNYIFTFAYGVFHYLQKNDLMHVKDDSVMVMIEKDSFGITFDNSIGIIYTKYDMYEKGLSIVYGNMIRTSIVHCHQKVHDFLKRGNVEKFYECLYSNFKMQALSAISTCYQKDAWKGNFSDVENFIEKTRVHKFVPNSPEKIIKKLNKYFEEYKIFDTDAIVRIIYEIIRIHYTEQSSYVSKILDIVVKNIDMASIYDKQSFNNLVSISALHSLGDILEYIIINTQDFDRAKIISIMNGRKFREKNLIFGILKTDNVMEYNDISFDDIFLDIFEHYPEMMFKLEFLKSEKFNQRIFKNFCRVIQKEHITDEFVVKYINTGFVNIGQMFTSRFVLPIYISSSDEAVNKIVDYVLDNTYLLYMSTYIDGVYPKTILSMLCDNKNLFHSLIDHIDDVNLKNIFCVLLRDDFDNALWLYDNFPGAQVMLYAELEKTYFCSDCKKKLFKQNKPIKSAQSVL